VVDAARGAADKRWRVIRFRRGAFMSELFDTEAEAIVAVLAPDEPGWKWRIIAPAEMQREDILALESDLERRKTEP
jgi:hypothetical protein